MMKNLNLNKLILALVFSFNVCADDTTSTNISAETTLNNTLRNNANNSTEVDKVKYLKLMDNSNGKSTEVKNLTDQEKQLSDNYVHQGMANRVLTKECSGDDNSSICAGNAPERKSLIRMVAKAYAIMGAMVDDKMLQLKKTSSPNNSNNADKTKNTTPPKTPDNKATDPKATDKKEEDAPDYCKYIPTATETIATFQEQMSAKTLSSATPAGETAQRDTILKAAKSHANRAKGAQIQMAGWYGGATCYTYLLATGYSANAAMVIKLGAALFLGNFYQGEVKINKEYESKTREIADILPGKGDCNPITQKTCYCSQPETENDATYCAEELHQKAIAATSNRVSCINSNLAADPKCNCENTGTCFEKFMLNYDTKNSLGFGTASGNNPISVVRALSHGELQSGVISGSAYGQSLAVAKQKLEEIANKLPISTGNFTKEQFSEAKIYQDAGLSGKAAAFLASANIPQSVIDKSMGKFNSISSSSTPAFANYNIGQRKSHLVEFGTSGNFGFKGKSNDKKGEDFKNLFNLQAKKDQGSNPSKIVEFANKAQTQNQVTKTDNSIFEIISNRYLNSGRQHLEMDAP